MNMKLGARLVSLGLACGVMLLALKGTASAAPVIVPELDPGTAGAGIALLVGSVLLTLELVRRRR